MIPSDVGRAAERTAMAWQRTGLALAGVSALMVRLANRDLALAVPGLAGFVLAVVLMVVGAQRYASIVHRVRGGESCLADRLVAVLTLGTIAIALGSLALLASL